MKKRILALAMSAFMLVGLNTAVFAEDSYKDMSSVDITKNYELAGEGVSPAETFKLTCTDAQVTDGDGTAATTDITISDVSYAAGAAGSEAKTGKFTITLPAYTKTGVYEYTLMETAGTTAGVTYRTEPMKLVVTVIQQDGLVRVAGVHTEKAGGKKSSSFDDNTYTANKLNVTKTVTGNLGDKSKEFKFTVTFDAPAGKDWTNAVTVSGGASDLNQNGNVYTFTLS
ncbi:MAG: FctA domain-containing protein, partial [Eubacteriales bacterium]|nr:FctA domain-containing protein [Eubacteriales bacterium]